MLDEVSFGSSCGLNCSRLTLFPLIADLAHARPLLCKLGRDYHTEGLLLVVLLYPALCAWLLLLLLLLLLLWLLCLLLLLCHCCC